MVNGMKVTAWVVLALAVLAVAYWLASPLWGVTEMNEALPSSSNQEIISQGDFVPVNHDVAGKAVVLDADGKKILRFEDFETENGPDLFIYLSADLQAEDFVNVGEIKATKGNVNYEIPDGVDLQKYHYALVWCRSFRVLFSYSDLR